MIKIEKYRELCDKWPGYFGRQFMEMLFEKIIIPSGPPTSGENEMTRQGTETRKTETVCLVVILFNLKS